MAILDDVKLALRITNTAYDTEIADLINEAKKDLAITGIIDTETDTLVKRAIKIYCKVNFGLNNPDSEKLQQSYDMLKIHLALSSEYMVVIPDVI